MTLNYRGQLVNISSPKVMGIMNVTPDSFFDGGNLKSNADVLMKAETMLKQGATFIDIGGYSTRHNATDVALEQELKRVIPVVALISEKFPEALISIDTFRSQVANEAVLAGAHMVNDVSGGQMDDAMFTTVAELKVPYVLMHMRGTPQAMVENCQYDDVTKDLIYYFSERLSMAHSAGIMDVIIDPGFGFSKQMEQNFELLQKLELLQHLYKPVLVGLSRKSMIYKTLGITPDEALAGTISLNTIALSKGAKILRVHDVKEAVQSIALLGQMS